MHKLYVSNLKTQREGTGNIRSQDNKNTDFKCLKNYVKHQENNMKSHKLTDPVRQLAKFDDEVTVCRWFLVQENLVQLSNICKAVISWMFGRIVKTLYLGAIDSLKYPKGVYFQADI